MVVRPEFLKNGGRKNRTSTDEVSTANEWITNGIQTSDVPNIATEIEDYNSKITGYNT
jgi:hypothetical protein